jgi:pimeloyl-ACP methyl ester carboxylesterase
MVKNETRVGGHAVRYYEAGEGPALILVHGAGGTGRIWHRQMGVFSDRFRVIAPDLPGFGGTDFFPDAVTVRGYGSFIAGFMDAQGIGSASVMAHSFGGWASCWFASEFPERLERLVLVAPSGLHIESSPVMSVPELIAELKRFYSYSVDEPEELTKAIDTITRLTGSGAFRPDLDKRLPLIKSPALIVWGRDDKVVPPAYSGLFRDGIKGSVLKVIDGAGHLPFMERPDEFNKAVLGFLGGTG